MNISKGEFVDAVAEAVGRYAAPAPGAMNAAQEPWAAVVLSMASGSLALQKIEAPGYGLVFSPETSYGAVGDVFAEVFFDAPDTSGPTFYLRPGESIRHPRGFGYFWVRATAQGTGYSNPWSLCFLVARDPLATWRGRERPAGNGLDPLNVEGQRETLVAGANFSSTVAGDVMVDTGSLPAGDYKLKMGISVLASGHNYQFPIEHRDATNTVNIAKIWAGAGWWYGFGYIVWNRYRIAANERVRILSHSTQPGTASAHILYSRVA
jgi:hypothetical protein